MFTPAGFPDGVAFDALRVDAGFEESLVAGPMLELLSVPLLLVGRAEPR
jgi:hypothetical protein